MFTSLFNSTFSHFFLFSSLLSSSQYNIIFISRADKTKYPHLHGLTERYCCTDKEAESPRSRCWWNCFLLRAMKENLSQVSLLGSYSSSFGHSDGCLHVHMVFSLNVSLFPNFPFFKNTSHVVDWPLVNITNYIWDDLTSKWPHILRY